VGMKLVSSRLTAFENRALTKMRITKSHRYSNSWK